MGEAPWHPIATAAQAGRILRALEAIAKALWEHREVLDPTLGSGLAGAALFLGCLGQRPGWEPQRHRALELLAMAVARADRAPGLGLYHGFPGIAWCVEHLRLRLALPGAADPNRGVDELILDRLHGSPGGVDYDLLRGLVGLGVYGLERRPAAGDALLRRVLVCLEDRAVTEGPGLAWATPSERLPTWQRTLHPGGHLDYGLAHGIPGVLALLAALLRAGIEPVRCGRLLAGGMASLLNHLRAPDAGSYLPAWFPLGEGTCEPRVERVAWCYGDLGASLALQPLAALGDRGDRGDRGGRGGRGERSDPGGRAPWADLPLAMARLAAARAPEASGVRDTGLCHGAAGNAHLFNRWHQRTGAASFRGAAQVWLGRTLDGLDPAGGFAGVTAFRSDPPAYQPCAGLLEGAAGVGLALLAALGGPAPAWDRILLASTAASA